MKKIAIVSLIHGDELIGLEVINQLKDINIPSIQLKFLKANIEAYKLKKRFIESDLNRSFDGRETYEGRLANEIKKSLENIDLIVDIHDTSAKTEPFLIVTKLTKEILSELKRFPIKKVVIMSAPMANGNSFIDHCNGFSIELDMNNPNSTGLCTDAILSFLKNEIKEQEKEFYIVFDKLDFETETNALENFKEIEINRNDKLLRFYPVLFGETDYDFKCLMAKKISDPKDYLID